MGFGNLYLKHTNRLEMCLQMILAESIPLFTLCGMLYGCPTFDAFQLMRWFNLVVHM